MEQEVATAYHEEVEIKEYTTYADVLVLVDDGSYDIPSTCAAAAHEYHAYANAVEYGTQNTCHALLVLAQYAPKSIGLVGDDVLTDFQIERQREYGIEGLHGELRAKLPPCQQQQYCVDYEQAVLHGKARGILYYGT
jgi:hypothetical protein